MATPPSSFTTNLSQARSLKHQANTHLNHPTSPSLAAAFPLYLQSAELYSLLVRQAPLAGLENKAKIKAEWAEVLRLAGKVKEGLKRDKGEGGVRGERGKGRCDRNSQAIILETSSTVSSPLGNLSFPLWSDLRPATFTSPFTYTDPHQPPIPDYLPASYGPLDGSHEAERVIWDTHVKPEELEQDAVRDCSFVAGVQAALGWSGKHGVDLLAPILHPRSSPSSAPSLPTTSSNNLHLLRLYFNGSWRTVSVDSSLPILPGGRPVGVRIRSAGPVVDQGGKKGLGLALLEKGWMKVNGGWDFPGSDSSIDLHALTGWVPETISMTSSDFQREKTWSRLYSAFKAGSCLLTIGTGKLSLEDVSATGLVASHNYALLDMNHDPSTNRRSLSIVNTWTRRSEAPTAISSSLSRTSYPSRTNRDGRLPDVLEDPSWTQELRNSLEGAGEDGIFELPWEVVCATFNTIHANWDPSLFREKAIVHSSWKASSTSSSFSSSFALNPQFILRTTSQSEIWLLLSRHIARVGVGQGPQQKEFMSLQVFEEGVGRADVGIGGASGGGTTYSDSPHILIRLTPSTTPSSFSLILSREASPNIETRFTLTAYSQSSPISIEDVPPPLPYSFKVSGEFLGRSAGGNVLHPTFISNPQYRLEIQSPPSSSPSPSSSSTRSRVTGELKLVLETTDKTNVPLNVKVVWGKGERVFNLVQGDVIADSGLYTHHLALCSKAAISPGIYTLILSTFSPRQESPYTLSLESSLPIDLKPIPQEGAGLFSRSLRGVWTTANSFGAPSFGKYERNARFAISVDKGCHIFFRLQPASSLPSAPHPPTPHPMNVSIFPSSPAGGSFGVELLSSGPYSDVTCGVATPSGGRLDKGEYVGVCSCYSPGSEGRFGVSVWSEEKVEVRWIE